MTRATHTFATLELSAAAYQEIAEKFRAAGYNHAFMEDGAIDMHGVAVVPAANTELSPTDRAAAGLPPGHRINDPESIRLLNDIGGLLGAAFKEFNGQPSRKGKPTMGFGLFIFDFGDGGNMFWLSNGQRDTMITALAEFIRKESN